MDGWLPPRLSLAIYRRYILAPLPHCATILVLLGAGSLMVTWGNLQSVIQLGIAVNLGYYSFTEIRQSALTRETRAIGSLQDFIREQPNSIESMHSEIVQMSIDLVTLEKQIYLIDQIIRVVSLTVSFVYISLIVYASVWPNVHIGNALAMTIAIFGFIPPLVWLIVNGAVVRRKLRQLESRRQTIPQALRHE